MTDALTITPHALGTETSSGTSASIDIGAQRTCLQLRLAVTAMTATRLAVVVESSPTAAGPWQPVGSLPAVTAPVSRSATFVNVQQFVRLTWTMAGADAAFRVVGEAHTIFATPDDVSTYAFPSKASDSLEAGITASSCLAATEEAATYLAGRFTFPILSWGQDVVMHVAKMAGYQIMARRGFQPQGSDELIVKGRDDAIAYFKMIGRNEAYPTSIVDSDVPNQGVTDAYIVENPASRWDAFGGSYADPVFGDPFTRG